MDQQQGVKQVIEQARGCKTPSELGQTLATGLGELVKKAARGGNPSVDCEDLGAAIESNAGALGVAIGEVVVRERQQA